jgi:hypothetical protein
MFQSIVANDWCHLYVRMWHIVINDINIITYHQCGYRYHHSKSALAEWANDGIRITLIRIDSATSKRHCLIVICQILISLIFDKCPDRVITSITTKPNILQKTLFHRFCPKFIKVEHGNNFFWPMTSWRLLEAKNTPRRPKMAWRSWFIEKSF